MNSSNNKPSIPISIYNLLDINIQNAISSNVNIISDINSKKNIPTSLSKEQQELIKKQILLQSNNK